MQTNRLFVRDVVTISGEQDLVYAAKLMREHHVGFLVVVDKRNGDQYPIGVLTDRDIVIESVAEDVSPHNLRVADVMVSQPLIIRESEDLEVLLARMCAYGVRRAPVVDESGRLAGIVSFDDLLQSISGMLNDIAGATKKQRETEKTFRG